MRTVLLLTALLLVACRKAEPPAPTPEQSSQLNDADSMLNDLGNEQGPANRSAGPANVSE